MQEIKALIRPERLADVIDALHAIPGMPGVTVSTVESVARRVDGVADAMLGHGVLSKLETVVSDALMDRVVATIQHAAHTGRAGDGKIFVVPVTHAVQIRTGGSGEGIL